MHRRPAVGLAASSSRGVCIPSGCAKVASGGYLACLRRSHARAAHWRGVPVPVSGQVRSKSGRTWIVLRVPRQYTSTQTGLLGQAEMCAQMADGVGLTDVVLT
jgi:hypothetical protein